MATMDIFTNQRLIRKQSVILFKYLLNITGTTSNIPKQPPTVLMTSYFTSDNKPPVPKITTLPKVPSVLQVPILSTQKNNTILLH